MRKMEADLSLEKIEFSKEADRIAALEKMIADRKSELEQLKNIIPEFAQRRRSTCFSRGTGNKKTEYRH